MSIIALKGITVSAAIDELKKTLSSHLVQPSLSTLSTGVSTGLPSLDKFLPWSGFPKGHLSLLYGSRGSGATSLWVNAAAEISKQKKWAAWINTPGLPLCPWSLRQQQADFSKILVIDSPSTTKKMIWILNELLSSCLFDFIGCDISHLKLRDFHLLKLKRLAHKQKASLIFIQQASRQLPAHPFYSLILQFKSQHILVQRALYRPTPHPIERRNIYADFMHQLKPGREALSR